MEISGEEPTVELLCPSCAFNRKTAYPDFRVGVFRDGSFREIHNLFKADITGSKDMNGRPDFRYSAQLIFHGRIGLNCGDHMDIVVNGINQGTYYVTAIRFNGFPTATGQTIETTEVELVGLK